MLRRAIASLAVCFTTLAALAVQPKPNIMPEEDVKTGMRGVA